jgi:hypothetical protein
MFLFNSGIKESFKQIAEKHFEKLKGRKKLKNRMDYYAYSIIRKIDNNAKTQKKDREFFLDLKDNNYQLTKQLITGNPRQLHDIIESIDQNVHFGRYPQIHETNSEGDEVLTDFGNSIKETFDYGTFSSKGTANWNAYALADLLGINVCAYCNRGYTFTILNQGSGIVRPEFDHFYSKSEYPYLALSFYNLIPSCHICNSNLKHRKQFSYETHLHPYEASLDSIVRFSVRLKSNPGKTINDHKSSFGLDFFYGDLDSFDLVLKANTGVDRNQLKKAIRNLQDFKIRELYAKHKDLVTDMILTATLYDDTYVNSLLSNHGNLFRDKFDVLRHLTKNYPTEEKMPFRAFSKLTKDVHSEFGLSYSHPSK